jgi:methyl-accepting chemotaxis protein
MLENSEKIEVYSSDSQEKLDLFNTTLHNMIANVEKIREGRNRTSQELFTNMAKIDHMIYKNYTYSSTLEGKMDEKLGDHNACELGKWYTNEGKKIFGHLASYKQLAIHHNQVHEHISKAMQFMNIDALKHSDEIISLFKNTEEASKKLFDTLDELIHTR